MTLSMKLRWREPDASQSINLRLKDVAAKGFLPFQPGSTTLLGAEISPVPFVLQVTVSPFVLSNFDGAVVLSDATSSALTVADGQINYVVCRARYRLLDTPILQMQVMTQAAYLGDPELNWLHVVGVVDLSVGGPYASVPTTRIFYENRHAVDQQTRSSWREPVATSGLLPLPPADHNRQGDVRLVTSTGSLYWWNESGSLWEVFDEVPLIVHRDHEHANGITGDSAVGTLLPGVSGAGALQAMDIGAVAVGSAYTVNGRLLQTPAVLTSTLASSVGAVRGLLRAEIDELAAFSYSYRVFLAGANNISYARIVDISDTHGAGTYTLTYDATGGTLSWDAGPAVAAPVAPSGLRRYRLYRPNGIDWIEVVAYSAPAVPGVTVSDSYTVNAPTDFETRFLVAHWFWDGSGALPLIVGQDKRRFGNMAFPQMGTEFKDVQFYPPETELRGNMVYSGGTCSALAGLNLRITGPIVAYVQGQRFVVAGSYNGTLLTASSTSYLYIDDAGVLQISTTDPATVFDSDGRSLQFAEVASVVTSVGSITTITDLRDPQLIVGAATRNARVRYTTTAAARWQEANKRLVIEDTAPGAESTTLETGGYRAVTGTYSAPSSTMTFDDVNTLVTGTVTLTNGLPSMTGSGTLFLTRLQPGTQFRVLSQNGGAAPEESTVYTVLSVASDTSATLTSNYTGVTGGGKTITRVFSVTSSGVSLSSGTLQPGSPNPSIISALYQSQLGNVRGLGVDDSGGAGLALSFLANSVTIATGQLRDFTLRQVYVGTAITLDTTALADGVYVVAWDQTANFSAGGFSVISAGTAEWRRHIALGFLQKSGGVNTAITDCAIHSAGHSAQLGFTVGQDPAGSGLDQLSNFRSLRAAMVFRCAYAATPYLPRHFILVDDIVEPTPIDFTSWELSGLTGTRLNGMSVVGMISGGGYNKVQVSWGTASVGATTPLIDFQYAVNSVSFENVLFQYLGDPGAADCCWIKDPGANLMVKNCEWQTVAGSALTSIVVYATTFSLGGTAVEGITKFENCQFYNSTYGASAMFVLGASVAQGRLVFQNCQMYGTTNGSNNIVAINNAAATVDVDFNNCVVGGFDTTLINTGAASYAGKLALTNSRIIPNSNALLGLYADIDLTNCDIADDINLVGARNVVNCRAVNGAIIQGDVANIIQGCDFQTGGSFYGSFDNLLGSKIALPTGQQLYAGSTVTDGTRVMDGCDVTRSVSGAAAVALLSVQGGKAAVLNTDFRVSGSTTDNTPWISVNGQSTFEMAGCVVDHPGGGSVGGAVIGLYANTSSLRALIHDNVITSSAGALITGSATTASNANIDVYDNTLVLGALVPASGYAIDFTAGATFKFGRVSLRDNNVELTFAQELIVRCQRAHDLEVDRNYFTGSNLTAHTITLGTTGSTTQEQRAVSFVGNTLITAANNVDVQIQDYLLNVADNNKLILKSTTNSAKSLDLYVAPQVGPATTGLVGEAPTVSACGNTLVANNAAAGGSTAATASLRVWGDAAGETQVVRVNNNTILTDTPYNAWSFIDVREANTVSVNDNLVVARRFTGGIETAEITETNTVLALAVGNSVICLTSGGGTIGLGYITTLINETF